MQTSSHKKYFKSFSFWWLVFIGALALFAPVISNKTPLHVNWNQQNKNTSAKTIDATNYRNEYLNNNSFSAILFAPIPYSAGETDADNLDLISPYDKNYFTAADGIEKELPLRFHHWMGTDKRGADVFAGVVHGTRYSLSIAFFSMLIATLIALLTGIISGYFVAEGIAVRRIHFYFLLAGLFFAWFYGFYILRFSVIDAFNNSVFALLKSIVVRLLIFIVVLLAFHLAGKYLAKKYSSITISFPVDAVISRFTETFTAIPGIILIITVVAIAKPSVLTIILIFGFTAWTDLSRIIRAEVMKLRQTNFIEAAIASGLNSKQIIFRHILPNILPVAMPVVLYGVAVIILAESGLSFLGLGVAPGTVTWGNLLAQGKENMEAWWLILFPGVFIFLTVNSLYRLGRKV